MPRFATVLTIWNAVLGAIQWRPGYAQVVSHLELFLYFTLVIVILSRFAAVVADSRAVSSATPSFLYRSKVEAASLLSVPGHPTRISLGMRASTPNMIKSGLKSVVLCTLVLQVNICSLQTATHSSNLFSFVIFCSPHLIVCFRSSQYPLPAGRTLWIVPYPCPK